MTSGPHFNGSPGGVLRLFGDDEDCFAKLENHPQARYQPAAGQVAADVISYCERLGMTVTVERGNPFQYRGQATWNYKIIASW
jgi:hypothetical protein